MYIKLTFINIFLSYNYSYKIVSIKIRTTNTLQKPEIPHL